MLRRGVRHTADLPRRSAARFLRRCIRYLRWFVSRSIDSMTQNALDGSFDRIRRADEHLADLQQRIEVIRRQQEDSIVVQFDLNPPHSPQPSRFTKTFVPLRVGILIGEICYNLRSALDYLIFELAEHDSGIPQGGTQFPIVDTKKDFEWWTKSRLKGVNGAHIAAIERLQPYRGCNWTKTLRDLSNIDKHREFANIKGDAAAYVYTRATNRNFDSIRASVRRTPHPIHGEMEVKVYVTSRIQFADGTPIIETLQEVKREVAATLEAFEPEF
jgi:hypothetical protein